VYAGQGNIGDPIKREIVSSSKNEGYFTENENVTRMTRDKLSVSSTKKITPLSEFMGKKDNKSRQIIVKKRRKIRENKKKGSGK
jgi:hypothetical protein